MTELEMFQLLKRKGMTSEGAAALLGNAWAESGLESVRLQGDFSRDRFKSKAFTKDIDSGFKKFDGRLGYGLFQWTFKARQLNLYSFAKAYGVSIGDAEMQLSFAVAELQNEYSGLWRYLCQTNDIYTATSRICKEFERPQYNNIKDRVEFAQMVLTRSYGDPAESKPNCESIMHLQAVLKGAGYNVAVTGAVDDKTKIALKDYSNKL